MQATADTAPSPQVPPSTGFRAAGWLLRTAILLFALGWARALFTRAGTSLGSVALLEWDVAHRHILLAEKAGAVVVLAAALSLLIRPTTVALVTIAALALIEAVAGWRAGGQHFSELTPAAHALRYLTPLALIPLIASSRGTGALESRRLASSWILRIGLFIVFMTHGYEAWMLHPSFVDFIISSASEAGLAMNEATASSILKGIAVADFVVALLVMVRLSPPLLGWLCFWGLITALARPVSLGFASYPEVLLRASHFLAPLAVAALTPTVRRRTTIVRPRPAPDPQHG